MANALPSDRSHPQPIPLSPRPDGGGLDAPLPVPLTSFVGREREVEQVAALLRRDDVRLVTLTGPGGVGKTRLALGAAEALASGFADGVAFVPLATIADPDLVLPTVARVLGVRQVGDRSLAERLADALRDRELLLVLDNFEQVVEAAPVARDLLAACPSLTVLTTSRERLRVSGERAYPVSPLALPPSRELSSLDRITTSAAVRLFVERAQAVDPDFALTAENAETIVAICERLDGLPLALELAAARIPLLRPKSMLGRLQHRLPLLTGGGRDQPDRLRTVRDAIAWSYDLLPPIEQVLFRHLSVFVGGFTLEAAEAVCLSGDRDGDVLAGLGSLVDKSLVRQEGQAEDELRYGMLETVREYGGEQLEASGDADVVRDRHATFYLALAERDKLAVGLPGPPARIAELERDDANLRAALEWAVERGDGDSSLRLVLALLGVWEARGRLREERAWLERVLALNGDADPALRVLARAQLGFAALFLGDEVAAAAAGEQALAEARTRGDVTGTVYALNLLSELTWNRGDHDQAEALAAEALALSQQVGDPAYIAWTLTFVGRSADARGDDDRAMVSYEESLTLWREMGHTWGVAFTLSLVTGLLRKQGHARRAAEVSREVLAAAWDLGAQGRLAEQLEATAPLALAAGQAVEAARLLGAAARIRERTGTLVPTKDRVAYERDVGATRATLGEEAFAAAWTAGEGLPLKEAVAQADAFLAATVTDLTATGVPRDPDPVTRSGLSPRELEVVRLIADGRSNQDIADALFIGHGTATTHVRNILTKLDLDNRAAVAAWATRHHLA